MGNSLTHRPGGIAGDARRREGVAAVLTTCRCNPSLICHCKPPPRSNEETPPPPQLAQPTRLDPCSGDDPAAARDPFGKLPPELLPAILSKLDVKQAARTSLLSSAWRHAWKWKHSPKLTLDIVAICGDGGYGSCKPGEEQYRAYVDRGRYVQRFIDTVDEILRQRHGHGVELELRFYGDDGSYSAKLP